MTAALKEPLPGWIETIDGPTGVQAGLTTGVLRVVRGNAELVADCIPVDFAINLSIAVA